MYYEYILGFVKASFQVPTWVRVSDLTEEDKAHYDSMMEKRQAAVATQSFNVND